MLQALGLRVALIGAACAVLIGGYHVLPVVGPGARLARAADQIEAKDRALLAARDALRQAAYDLRVRDQRIEDISSRERDDASAASAFWKGQCRHAFDAGYAARRCDGGDDAGGVRDLRALQAAGAFVAPARPVPGKHNR